MTKETAINQLILLREHYRKQNEYLAIASVIALDIAIEELEKEPCEDCVERKASIPKEWEDAFKEDIEKIPIIKAIPLDKVEKAREAIENLPSLDGDPVFIEKYDVLEILDKLIESEDK